MKFFTLKRIIAIILALVILAGTIVIIKSCSSPPKYEKIEARFKELTEKSHDANTVLFGEGLPTYEHVYDPKSSTEVFHTGEYTENDQGEKKERLVYYYYTLDKENTVIAFRDSYLKDFAYALVSESELTEEQLAEKFPRPEGDTAEYYSKVYSDKNGYCYSIPYEEKKYDFYYSKSDDADYDFVRFDSEYRTVDDIKKLAESVYSSAYTQSLYAPLFDGISSGGTVMTARYREITADNGSVLLAQSNTYEYMKTEKRVYLFETAKINKLRSNRTLVRISIDSYLPSNPDEITNGEITIVYERGDWYLNSPTF